MTFYAVNLLWSISTLAGFILAAYLAREGYLDLQAIRALKANGDKSVLAKAAIAAGIVGALGQLFLFVPVVPTFFAPPPDSSVSWVVALLVMGSWCLTAKTGITVWANRTVQAGLTRRSGDTAILEGMDRLHKDNLETASILKDADKKVTRRVTNVKRKK